MATSTSAPQASPGITLNTVIVELQFILELSTDNPGDPRLKQLVKDAATDLATASRQILGDDSLITK